MEENKSQKMGTMPVGKLLFQMSFPIGISMLVQSIYNIVDSMFVSRVSEEALTAVSLAFPVQNVMLAFAIGIGVGAGALLGRFLGMGDSRRVGSVAMHGYALAGIIYVIFAILGILFSDAFARNQSQSQIIYEYTRDYLSIVTVFSVGMFLQLVAEKLLQATSLTYYTMIVQSVGALVNMVLDPILIFGLFGFPRLEVKGAAIATVIGQISGATIGIIINKVKNKEIQIRFHKFKFHADILRQIFWIGLPSIVMTSVSSVVVFALNTILQSFGQSAIAAYGVMFKLQTFAFLPVQGLSNGLVSIVSYNYGARLKERIKDGIKKAIGAGFIIVLIVVIILWLFPNQLLDLFHATDAMRRIGVPMIRIVSISYLVASVSIVAVGVLQSLGNWQSAILQSVLRQLLILVPIFYLLSLTGNLDIVWWSFLIAEGLDAIYCIYILKRDIRKKVDTL